MAANMVGAKSGDEVTNDTGPHSHRARSTPHLVLGPSAGAIHIILPTVTSISIACRLRWPTAAVRAARRCLSAIISIWITSTLSEA